MGERRRTAKPERKQSAGRRPAKEAPGRSARREMTDNPARPGLLGVLMNWRRGDGQETAVEPEWLPATRQKPAVFDVAQRLEYAFRRLHHDFSERERQLEARVHELQVRQDQLLQARRRQRKWAFPLIAGGMLAIGYVLYVLTTMQYAMTSMSGEVTAMSGHMGEMATDTRAMSRDIGSMNRSMTHLNGSMAQMNRNVGAISQATVPMGQAAGAVSPFMQAFRSFMPFF